MDLKAELRKVIEPLLPNAKVRASGRGRPWKDLPDVLNGILWVLRTGAPRADLPARYSPYQSFLRRFQVWCRDGTLEKVLIAPVDDLNESGKLDMKWGRLRPPPIPFSQYLASEKAARDRLWGLGTFGLVGRPSRRENH